MINYHHVFEKPLLKYGWFSILKEISHTN